MKGATSCLAVLVLLVPAVARANWGDVVINEVAWMGSDSSFEDEWIELHNTMSIDLDLTGWILAEGNDLAGLHRLSGTIPAGGYFVIERREEATSGAADLVVSDLALSNAGERLELVDSRAVTVDLLDCTLYGWAGGTDETPKASMERSASSAGGCNRSSWHSNDGVTRNGTDSQGAPFRGTPGQPNSEGDARAPGIVGVSSVSPSDVALWFDEPVARFATSDFTIDGTIHPGAVALQDGDPRRVELSSIEGLTRGDIATLTIDGVADATGNVVRTTVSYTAGVVDMAIVQQDDEMGRPTMPDGVYVTVMGHVAATVFSSSETQIYDRTGGVTLYDSLAREDAVGATVVRAAGQVGTYNGKTQLGFGAGSVEVWPVSDPSEPPILVLDPARWAADPEGYEGLLVGFHGLSLTGGSWPGSGVDANLVFSAADGTTLPVRIDRDTDLDGSPAPAGPGTVVGVSGQFDQSLPYTDGYQVLPRSQADFVVTLCTCAPETMVEYWCRPVADACEVVTCVDGRENCDGLPGNGCEADLRSDPTRCGACDRACGKGERCESGVCVCPDADGDGHADAACGGDDCDDLDAAIHPAAVDVCGNGVDEDCSGTDLSCEPDGGVDPGTDGGVSPGTDGGVSPGTDGGADGGTSSEGEVAQPASGCGCSATSGGSAGGLGLLLVGLAARRRRIGRRVHHRP